MDATNTLQRLIDSNYRIAALKTLETDRLIALFKRYSLTTGQAVYDWTCRSGLYRVGVEHVLIPRTRTPADVIAYIAASRHYGIYLLREFEPALTKPSIQDTLRKLCDLDDGIHRLVLLIGNYSHLPSSLQGRIATVRHNVRERHSSPPAATHRANLSPPTNGSDANRRPRATPVHPGPYLATSSGKEISAKSERRPFSREGCTEYMVER